MLFHRLLLPMFWHCVHFLQMEEVPGLFLHDRYYWKRKASTMFLPNDCFSINKKYFIEICILLKAYNIVQINKTQWYKSRTTTLKDNCFLLKTLLKLTEILISKLSSLYPHYHINSYVDFIKNIACICLFWLKRDQLDEK